MQSVNNLQHRVMQGMGFVSVDLCISICKAIEAEELTCLHLTKLGRLNLLRFDIGCLKYFFAGGLMFKF
jgi:hypothetical protein